MRALLVLALTVATSLPLSPVFSASAAEEAPAAVVQAAEEAPAAVFQAAEEVPAAVVQDSRAPPSRQYLNITGFPFPLGPFTERNTVKTEIVKGKVYSFEQELRLSGISANVRSTVFRMRDNHLLVYNPVAPTEEFLRELESLNHAGVSHILLGATPYEHKVFVGPFARKFPTAKVWAVPDQWSFPLDLPAPLLGIDTEGTGGGELVDTSAGSVAYRQAPDFLDEFEVKLLRPEKRLGFGYSANEAALFHKDTKTLALTDALISVPSHPTQIYDETNLLAVGDNARDSNSLGNLIIKAAGAVNWQGTGASKINAFYSGSSSTQDATLGQLQRGWERNVLLSLFFGPSPDSIVDPDPSFQKLKDKWVVAPVTDALIYRSEKVKPELARWVDDVSKWEFSTISPSHFAAREGTPEDFRAAFAPTLATTTVEDAKASSTRPYPKNDVRLLDDIAGQLVKLNVI
jgi:hypothetical protein